MIEFSPSGTLAALTVPMDKKHLMQFDIICRTQLRMTPEEAVRKTIYQVLTQDAQNRGEA
ncbi:MAG TPA: hypothetical protein O0X42_01025 [Methanocorpusculum sp.]|nr:hypothetical protein [Methanocorpusculum sp.]